MNCNIDLNIYLLKTW